MSLFGWVLANAAIVAGVALLVLAIERWVIPIPPDEAPAPVPLVPPLLVAPPELPDQPPPPPLPAEGEGHVYAWDFAPRNRRTAVRPWRFQVNLRISTERYRRYRAEAREPDPTRWTKYAEEQMPELTRMAWELNRLHLEAELSPFDQASNVLCFAQSCVRYEHDWITHDGCDDWPNYPIESLYERLGDCEDHAILAAAILKRLGFDVALLSMPGHMAVGLAVAPNATGWGVVVDGVRYLFGETTASGWYFGDLPRGIDGGTVKAYPVKTLVETEP